MSAPLGNRNAVGNKGGRPTKLNSAFIIKAKEVLKDESIILFTDIELVEEINDRLPKEARISIKTYESWKSKYISADLEEIEVLGIEFIGVLKKAIRTQKKMLLNKMIDPNAGWQKFAWIIERKFSEWNIKRRVEATIKEPRKYIIQEIEDEQ